MRGSSHATPLSRRWNGNIHYYPVLFGALPPGCERALDIGCGEGTLARRLRKTVANVSAIDVDAASIDLARRAESGSTIDYVVGDFLTHPFTPARYDFVVCVAALHHMETAPALRRMVELLRPGGTLAILGLARSTYPADLARDLAAAAVSRTYRITRAHWESPTPTVWPPPETFGEVEALAEHVLPGATFRRHLLWRYSIAWTKPD